MAQLEPQPEQQPRPQPIAQPEPSPLPAPEPSPSPPPPPPPSPPPPPPPSPPPPPPPQPQLQPQPQPKPAAPPQPPPLKAEDLYERAEAALRNGHHGDAKALLREIARRWPGADGDQALYELALLAKRDGDVGEARARLDELIAHDAHAEAARYLRCRLDADAKAYGRATACLETFRRDFPRSPHDAESLAALASFAQAEGDCDTALKLLREYLERYPRGPFAAEAKERSRRCSK